MCHPFMFFLLFEYYLYLDVLAICCVFIFNTKNISSMNTLCTDCLYLFLTGGTGTAGGAGSVGGTTIGTGSSTGGSKSGSGGQSNNASSSSNSNEHASNYMNSSNLPARGVIDVNLATRTGKVQDTNLICCSSRFKTLFF
jgi:hypothetical protein